MLLSWLKKNLDSTAPLEEVPNISDINNLLNYLEESISSAQETLKSSNVSSDTVMNPSMHKYDEREMQKLTK